MSVDFWEKVFLVGRHLGTPDGTLRKWRQRGNVPASKRIKFFQTAPKLGVRFTLEELDH